jgi:hypothetical protein
LRYGELDGCSKDIAFNGAIFNVVLGEITVFIKYDATGCGVIGDTVDVLDVLTDAPMGGSSVGVCGSGVLHFEKMFADSE